MSRLAIASLFTALSPSDYSHNSGYIRIIYDQLAVSDIQVDILWTRGNTKDQSWENYDQIYLYQGLPLNGRLGINAFGGKCPKNVEKLCKLADYTGSVIPIGHTMLAYSDLAKSWGLNGAIVRRLRAHETWSYNREIYNIGTAKTLVVGDSHALAVTNSGEHVILHCGRTLHNVLVESDLASLNYGHDRYSTLRLYFGNIDLRHHWCRQPDPMASALEAATAYVQLASGLLKSFSRVELVKLLPLCSDDREIPGPGKYKGQPYAGSWDMRNECRLAFNDVLSRAASATKNLHTISHPPIFVWPGITGRLSDEVMERPRSVHIAPRYYMRVAGLARADQASQDHYILS